LPVSIGNFNDVILWFVSPELHYIKIFVLSS